MGPLNPHGVLNSFKEEVEQCQFRPSNVSLACMINSEIGAVLAVMRRNVRWGVCYVVDEDQLEHSLIHSLKELRKQIFSWQHDWHKINPAVYLQPFLDVVQSDETGAPLTGVALSSIYKILTLDMLDLETVNVEDAMCLIVDAVTSCRFEVTDPASEEVVPMKILQVLIACIKNKASAKLSNQHVCNIVNTCFRIVHQASSKGELLQRIARHTMHELVRCIFSHLPVNNTEQASTHERISCVSGKVTGWDNDCNNKNKEAENCIIGVNGQPSIANPSISLASTSAGDTNKKIEVSNWMEATQSSEDVMMKPFGVPCMVEIFHFLCSLLNVIEHNEFGPRSNPVAHDEDVPLFALGLINSAIELAGPHIHSCPELLAMVQDELFHNLMKFGLSTSPLILSTVCSIVFNLYHHLRTKLKVQLEVFFSGVLLRLAQNKHGSSYQQQEVALEALVDLCRQNSFVAEMYSNYDCDINCSNVFEDLANLLSKSLLPVNGPQSAMQILALDGLISMVQGMAERTCDEFLTLKEASVDHDKCDSFWSLKCENYSNPVYWVPFVRKIKYIKRKLMNGAEHFNRDPKKGLEFLQRIHLLPDMLDTQSVACFLRYTSGLEKNLIGDYLGNHDEFCVQVLHEFAKTFDFSGMNLDTALRLFIGTFRLPGESQKIQRVLEAFAERYYEQSPHIFCNKDATLLLSYSLILLNTDQHNVQVKRKMTEEDFIRNNRRINGGNDLPREFLSELYHSICENEIQMIPEQSIGFPVMRGSHWINVTHKSKNTTPFIACDSTAVMDYDMFVILSGPTVAALSVVFDRVEQEDVLQRCVDGFLAIAKISACYHFVGVLNDLVVSLCKFTTLLSPISIEEALIAFGDDIRAKMATTVVFTIAIKYGDFIRSGWKNIVDCVLSLYKLGFLPARLTTDTVTDLDPSSDAERAKPTTINLATSCLPSMATPRKSYGLMGRFSQLLSFDLEEPTSQPSEEELAAHQRTLATIENCHIDSIFAESKFLQAESLSQLVGALILAAGQLQKGTIAIEDEGMAVFCLELLIAITLDNRDRILLIWHVVHDHISNIVQSTIMPCPLVERAVFGLLRICQQLLPYKESLTDELFKSLQLILKLDARVADAYCEQITQEVLRLVKENATHIRSHVGWRTIISLLSITARHPEASEVGFKALEFIMSEGAHLFPTNYVLCVDAARQFVESRVGEVDQSVSSLNLMVRSIECLVIWSHETKHAATVEAAMMANPDIGEMWLRLVQGLKKVCLDQREEVRNHAILVLQRSLAGVERIDIPNALWLMSFDGVIFPLLDDLLEISLGSSPKDYRNMEGSLVLAMKLMSKVFLQFLLDLWKLPFFCKLWLGVLNCMEKYMKAKFRGKHSEKIHELVPELLKNTLFVMKTTGILVPSDAIGADSFWQLTWLNAKNISSSMQAEVFSGYEFEKLQTKHAKAGGFAASDGTLLVQSE